MVFRRDNKVDSFQRQMSALRNQLGASGEELDDVQDDMPELDDDQYDDVPYRGQQGAIENDNAGYSFGNFPSPSGQAARAPFDEDDSPALPDMPATDANASVIAADATWNGDINAERSVHVYGNVQGTITASEDIWIAEGAEVSATVSAQRVIVGGQLSGAANAASRFEVLPTGRVAADVTSPITVVHEGATINGNFRVGGGEGSSDSRGGNGPVIQRRARTAS